MHWHLSSLRSLLDALYSVQALPVPHRQGEACGSGPTSNFNLLKAHFYASFKSQLGLVSAVSLAG